MASRHNPHTMNHELLRAVDTGDAGLLARVLGLRSKSAAERDETCLEGVTAEGSSALHIAASRGHLELVVTICAHDISLATARNDRLDTPLICAARAGHADVVDYLINRASNSNLQEAGYPQLVLEEEAPVDSGCATAMHEAVRNGHAAVLRALMMARDRRLAAVVDGQGVSPLYMAVVSSRADMVDILIRESSDGVRSPASYAGPHGRTALHAAVYANNAQEMAEALLRWEPSLAEEVDSYGRTALHYAASAGKTEVVKLLLVNNSSPAYIPDNNGLFPAHVAAIAGNTKVIRELAETCPGCVEFVDNKHRNVLHCAVEHGSLKVVWHIRRNPKFASMMNAGDSEGNTPLHLAVKQGHLMIFTLLMMDLRVNLSNINHEGLTPLNAVFNGKNYSFSSFRNAYISACFLGCEAYRSSFCRPRNLTGSFAAAFAPPRDDEKEASGYTNVSQSISLFLILPVSVLKLRLWTSKQLCKNILKAACFFPTVIRLLFNIIRIYLAHQICKWSGCEMQGDDAQYLYPT